MSRRMHPSGHPAERHIPWEPRPGRSGPKPTLAPVRRRLGAGPGAGPGAGAGPSPDRAALIDAVRLRLAEIGAAPTAGSVAAALRAAQPRWAGTTFWTPSEACAPNWSEPARSTRCSRHRTSPTCW